MKTLREIMRPEFLFTVQRGATVRDAVQVMTANNVGIVLVLEGERLVGVFSERDVVRRVVDRGLDPARTPVGDVMTTQLVVGDPDEDYQSAIRKMDQANIRHLLVVKGSEMLSMISIRDLIRVDMQDKGEEIRYLREYLYQVPAEVGRPELPHPPHPALSPERRGCAGPSSHILSMSAARRLDLRAPQPDHLPWPGHDLDLEAPAQRGHVAQQRTDLRVLARLELRHGGLRDVKQLRGGGL
jgi:CBS domain-containing protein